MVSQQARPPRQDSAAFGTEAVIHAVTNLANVHTVHESGIGDETRTDVVVNGVVVEVSRAVTRFGLVGRSGFIASVLIFCRTGNRLKISRPVWIELQSTIDSAYPIKCVRRRELPIGVDRSNTGLPKNVAIQ